MSAFELDRSQWRSFLELLGKDIRKVRLRSFFPKGHPLKERDRGKKSNANGDWIKHCQEEGRGVYLVINDGEDTDSSITGCRAFFYEHDDIPKEEQIYIWKELGLPEPSIQIDTGGKSIHNYWILKKAIEPETWKPIQERLLDYADADRALKNPSRVMRLPGTFHMKDDGTHGGMTQIIHTSDMKYTVKDIEKCLPTKKQHEKNKESVEFKEYRKEDFATVQKALAHIPPRTPGSNTYHMYRNILWGLIKACEDAGKSSADAISLMREHSPAWGGLDQVAKSGGQKIEANSFWYWAMQHGYKPPKVMKVINPDNPDNPTLVHSDKLQKIEANELLNLLKTRRENGEHAFRYNIFTQQIELNGVPCQGSTSIDRYYLELARQGYKCNKDTAFDCVVQIAREYEYNPVTDYLNKVYKTESPAYIDRLASAYLRPEDAHLPEPTIYDDMLKKTLIAAVARAYKPEGHKFDNACVLLGEQGARKSTFWSVLGGEFFSDGLRDINGKDSLMILHRSWICEMAELEAVTSKKMAGEIKSFLSQEKDVFRVPYGKVTEEFPRRGIIVGSTNRHDGFLVDETGNRRFWIIKLGENINIENPIDCEGLLAERNQIWAAAVMAYKNGETTYLTKENEVKVNEENLDYLIESPWKAVIESFCETPQNYSRELTTELVLSEAIEKPIERQTRYDQMQVATILKNLGYEKKRRGSRGCRKWVYIRDSERVLTSV